MGLVQLHKRRFRIPPQGFSGTTRQAPSGQLCRRDGWPLRRAAERFQVSVPMAARWAGRYRELGEAGIEVRSSQPALSPGKDPATAGTADHRLRLIRRRDRQKWPTCGGMHPEGPVPLTALNAPARGLGPRGHQETRPDPQRRRRRAVATPTSSIRSSTTIPGMRIRRSSSINSMKTAAGFWLPGQRRIAEPRYHRPERADRQRLLLLPSASTQPSAPGTKHKYTRPHRPPSSGKVELTGPPNYG